MSESALRQLAQLLREEDTPISPHVVDSNDDFAPGSGEYAWVIESVREGYLLHYGTPRLLAGHDSDLALLAGDYLYALGIERLARLGDASAVKKLADLISLSAQLHTEDRIDQLPDLWQKIAIEIDG